MNIDAVSGSSGRVPSRDQSMTAQDRRAWSRARAQTRVADRSLELIEDLYRQDAPRFRRVALAIVHDVETAEDVVQEAFANAVLRRRTFRGSGAASGWIWRIVVNTALSRRRRLRIEARACEAPEPQRHGSSDDELRDLVREHVARLPERQRLALFLRYYADLDYEEIAHTLSIAPGTVGKLLHDARTNIGRAVEGEARG
jgi:RNA polymerase sigma factor (sigma-70 family)